MNDYLTTLPGLVDVMAQTCRQLDRLDLATLPRLASVAFSYAYKAGTWNADGQMAHVVEDEAGDIDAIRAWAGALGAELHLSDRREAPSSGTAFRRLEAVKTLDHGAILRIWTHIALTPLTPAAPVAAAA